MKGVSKNAEQVAVWVGGFGTSAHLDLAIEVMYCHEDEEENPCCGNEGELGERKTENKYKEEEERLRKMDETDRNKIAVALQKH